MNHILENYLRFLSSNNLDKFLSGFKKVITYSDQKEIKIGLLKYKEPPENGTAFLFKLPKEEILYFHTIGMHFPIRMYFFDSKKHLVYSSGIVNPGVKVISSKSPAKYVVEIPNYN